ncbi:transposase [Mesorhizobium sp. M0924]|uniref:transposase n=1 Tax=unclassified Mesorhizobium TaxID=325217 RepID=UPI003339C1D2
MSRLREAALRRAEVGAGLAYLGRYAHRVAIANSLLISRADDRVAFRWGTIASGKSKVMTLDAHELIRRFLLRILPDGFHRIPPVRLSRQR